MYKKISDFKNVNEFIVYLISTKAVANFQNFYQILNNVDAHYIEFTIPKKYSADVRTINAPDTELKKIQKRIKMLIEHQLAETNFNFKKSSQAYQKDKNIFTNAQIHRNKKYVVHLDIEKYFDNIRFNRINGLLQKNARFKLDYQLSTIITRLCCFNGHLTQGSPVSPIFSNLIGERIDTNLLKISKKFHFTYTRYSDDLTFSTNDHEIINTQFTSFLNEVKTAVSSQGFTLNDKKYSIASDNSRHIVTGLTNNKKVAVPIEFYKWTRAMANTFYQTNSFYIGHKKYDWTSLPTGLRILEGRFNHIYNIEQQTRQLYQNHSGGFEYTAITPLDHHLHRNPPFKNKDTNQIINQFTSRELEYSKFLFFKTFWYGNSSTIFTEGKTDARYINKAHDVLQTQNVLPLTVSSYYFKDLDTEVTKESMLSRVFNLHAGGKGLKKILVMYLGGTYENQQFISYAEYFKKKQKPNKPTIFLYDFELGNNCKDSPLNDMLNFIDTHKAIPLKKDEIQQNLKQFGFQHIIFNLYIAVTTDFQLIDATTNNATIKREIEDYFPEDFLLDVNGDGQQYCETVSKKHNGIFGKTSTAMRLSKNDFSFAIQKKSDPNIFYNFKNLFDIIENISQHHRNTKI